MTDAKSPSSARPDPPGPRQDLAQEAWQRAERRMVDLLGVGVAYRRRDGLILRANSAAIAILGLTRAAPADAAAGADEQLRPDPRFAWIRDDGSVCAEEDEPFARAIQSGENQGPIRLGLRRREDLVTWAVHQVLLVYEPDTG